MEKKEFDKKVQELMAGFEEKYDPTSWDSFEKKLQFEEEMDDLIKQSVESYEEPFNEKHWELLTQELERRKMRSFIKRVSEVVIVLLLILTVHNFLQFKTQNQSDSREIINIALLEDQLLHIENQDGFVFSDEYLDFQNDVKESISSNSRETFQEHFVNDEENIQFKNLTSNTDGKHFEKTAFNNGTVDQKGERPFLITPQELDKFSIAFLDVSSSNIQSLEQEKILTITPKDNGFWIGLMAGPDVNFINSPFDLNLLRNPIQSQSGTVTYGVTFSKDIGLFEVNSAVLYSRKIYSPFRIREFVPSINQKYLETSLRSLEFEQIQIPLLANIHTRRYKGLSLFGTIGIGANIITKTSYDVETQVRSFSSAPASSTGVEKLNLRDLPRGAFQSGSVSNNVYFSAIAGFGIEKRIFNKFAFTFLTTYQRGLTTEINPVINRTQQLSMSLGVKMNLK